MLFADGISLDWTAIAIAGLTGMLSIVGLLIRRSFGKLDTHMEKVEKFMEESGKTDVAVAIELKNHKEWINELRSRANDSERIHDTHRMVTELHGGDERRSA